MNDRESYAAGIENVCDGVRQLSVGPFGGDEDVIGNRKLCLRYIQRDGDRWKIVL